MTYTVQLEPAPEGGYVVTVPALPEVVTEGDSLDEALAAAEEALTCALLARRDLGEPWPEDDGVPALPANVITRCLSPALVPA